MSNADELLSFKEFPPIHENHSRGGSAQININSPKKNVGFSLDDSLDLLSNLAHPNDSSGNDKGDGSNETDSSTDKTFSIWSIEYYQQFFNVDTMMVVDRIATSMIPKRAPGNYLRSHIGLNPDLYGPFWIIMTLVFSIGISGNISNYLQHADTNFKWRYNFHLVSYAATAIIMYACIIPLALWAAFKWTIKPVDPDLESESSVFTPNLLALICIYGYSLAIYIPVSILWVIQISILQWLLVITAAFLSGSVLVFVLLPALRNSRVSLFIVVGIIAAHFILAAGFMLYFFHVPTTDEIKPTIAPIVQAVAKVNLLPIVNATVKV